jgi:hypothetical protein
MRAVAGFIESEDKARGVIMRTSEMKEGKGCLRTE